ncbi:winged helix-turn-helix domain-containing protein [Streptomyces prasinus]|uniref:FadR family transcriptional regulator n=1 Tax=Streptomyces prasinus TaxID=67345 RepID=A0ABX6AYK2_9ACTN|nr:GntR family transcriptional regulator [Streptomyces prasinus]QEV07082.1 FadR family transcriptional regulator [Streptomyces prasinus]
MDPEYASVNGRKRPQRPQRTHREVADELRARIRSGELRPGQRMPTQAKLADEFGVERGAVRQALRILQSEQLLTNVAKGAPATVAGHPGGAPTGPEAPPRPTTAALAPRVAAAFEAEHVEIDSVCLTAASLTLAIGEPLRRIHAGRMKPAKVDVRVLLPGRDIDLAFPVAVEDSGHGRGGGRGGGRGEDPVHERWLAMRNAQGQVLRHHLLALRATHGVDVRVTFRALPFTPPVKLYLLNGVEALFAYYTLSRGEDRIGEENVQTYDAQGSRSALFAFERDAGVRDGAFVTQSRLWFDALWETISSELRLTR